MALFRQWSSSASPQLRIQAARTLRGLEGRDSRVALFTLLDDDHPGVRAAVRHEIVLRPPDEGPDLAAGLLALRRPRARLEGLRALLERKEDPTPFAADPDPRVRTPAISSERVTQDYARWALERSDGPTRAFALECLKDPSAAAAFQRDRSEEVRIACARITDDPGVLSRLLADRSWRVRLAAVLASERMRRVETVPGLIDIVGGPPGRVRARAAATLEALTTIQFGEDEARWRAWWKRAGPGFTLPEPRASAPRKGHTTAALAFRRIPVHSKRLCFVLDASRSMEKPAPGGKGASRWDLVVRDLFGVLERLPPDARFNVVLFRTDVASWSRQLVPAGRGAVSRCRRWVESQRPGGWTNLFDAVAVALADDDVDALYVLTDGVPSRGAETRRRAILDEIEFLNRYRLVQVNCVQAGGAEGLSKAWRGFLDELAAAHDGVSVRE